MKRRTKWILGVGGVVVALLGAVVIVAVIRQERLEQVPDHFPREEPTPTDRRAPWPPRFGVNANLAAKQPSDPFRMAQFQAIARGGLGWIRVDVDWSAMQPERSAPVDFGRLDAIVRDAAVTGLDIAAAPLFTPKWASTLGSSNRTPAKDPVDTDRFVRTVVQRYGPGGKFWRANPTLPRRPIRVWEIWNEENVRHFFAPRSAKTYAHHAVVVARAIRSVDPAARILFGGLSGHLDGSWQVESADDFLSDAIRAQPSLGRLLDGVAIHAYGDAAEAAHVTCAIRETMNRVGLRDKALVFNEFGWNTSGPGALDEAARARWLGEIVAAVVKPETCPVPRRLVMIAPYTWWSPRRNPDDKEQWFGLADDRGQPFLSGRTYIAAAAGAERAVPR